MKFINTCIQAELMRLFYVHKLKTTSSRTAVLECPKIAEQFFGL
jgi:hypothetical protein